MSPVRVDFYLLNEDMPQARMLLACKLVEKAYKRGHRVFIYCKDMTEAHALDELLWTFKADSFIPHHLQGEGLKPPPPVQIGWEAVTASAPYGFQDILLNLSDAIPSFYRHFKRIMEIVCNDEAAKALSRQHYRHYRVEKCELHTHTLDTMIFVPDNF